MKNTRRGFTMVELAVVICIVFVLILLLLPAIQKAREAYQGQIAAEAATAANQSGNGESVAGAPVSLTIPDVYDADSRLAIDGSNEAIVLYFYSRYDEQCTAQEPLLGKVAAKWSGKVKFVKIDYMSNSGASTNIMHVVLYNVHHTPTFILRRKGESLYRTRIGLLSEDALNAWIAEGLQSSADR